MKKECEVLLKLHSLDGGAYGARTRDLMTASHARSQLRQCPMEPLAGIEPATCTLRMCCSAR